MTIWLASSSIAQASGRYADGISRGLCLASGLTDNYNDRSDLADPCRGPGGFRGFRFDVYVPGTAGNINPVNP